jgi:hypothetical protein
MDRHNDRLESEIDLRRPSHVVRDSRMSKELASHSLSRMDDLRCQVAYHGAVVNHRSRGYCCNCAPLLPPHKIGRKGLRKMSITEASIGEVDDDGQ